MIISDLNVLEVAENITEVQGGRGGRRPAAGRDFQQTDTVNVNFKTTNTFETIIKEPSNVYNISAAAGAKGVADVKHHTDVYSYTKGDSLAVVDAYGNSFSVSTSAALINWS
jgi:hypothetical protein